MADCYFLCALFVFLHIVGGTPHIKGLYCQDPDTLKLYPINSTWPSETFCGNYTCKLRKKNITQTEYAPLKKINITEVNKRNATLTSDMATSPSEHAFVVINQHEPTKQPVYNKEAVNKVTTLADNDKNGNLDDQDRFLTESEIKTITEILHTVKKSDLDAIVEIYNIAHDIYKEMDVTTEKIVKDGVNTIKSDKNDLNNKSSAKDSVSYWYEPVQHSSTKVKPKDSKPDGTDSVPTTKGYTYPPTYFNGLLTEKDFRKLPYYYPMSNFQRMSSYVHNMPYNIQENIPRQHRPCKYKHSSTYLPPMFNTPTKAREIVPEHIKPQAIQSMLLPYPFSYINHYNFSRYPNSFYYSNPWAIDSYNRQKNYPQQYFNQYFTPDRTTAVAPNVEEMEQKYDDHFSNNHDTDSTTNTEGRFHEWQTEQLSDEVLKDVKANILENSKLPKPLSLRKNIKLEKVGKVVKLDELMRTKRNISEFVEKSGDTLNVQYEPYIEKTTCESSTELGFFRMGNLNEPYPACCPQKIRSLL